jgi:hypothetical protein
VRRDDEDDRSGEGGRPGGDPFWIDHVVVPNDIRELDAEVRAWQRERRARSRRERLRRLASPSGVAGPLLIVALLLVAGLASLVVLFQPRRPSTQPAPLATPGVDGAGRARLLPDVPVRLADGSTRPVRDYRPAVLALAPVGCGCDPALREVGSAADRFDVPFLLVDRSVPPLPAGLVERAVVRLAEPTGALAATYGAEAGGRRRPGGPVLVLVGSDGQVVRVLPRPTTPRALETELAVLSLSSPVR